MLLSYQSFSKSTNGKSNPFCLKNWAKNGRQNQYWTRVMMWSHTFSKLLMPIVSIEANSYLECTRTTDSLPPSSDCGSYNMTVTIRRLWTMGSCLNIFSWFKLNIEIDWWWKWGSRYQYIIFYSTTFKVNKYILKKQANVVMQEVQHCWLSVQVWGLHVLKSVAKPSSPTSLGVFSITLLAIVGMRGVSATCTPNSSKLGHL